MGGHTYIEKVVFKAILGPPIKKKNKFNERFYFIFFLLNFIFIFACRSTQPKPDKAILNLTTQIDSLRFCAGGELLGLASISKEAAVKLLHTPTMTVYQNFPGQYKHLGKVHFITKLL